MKKTMVCCRDLMKTIHKATNRPGTTSKRTVPGQCSFMYFMYMVALFQAEKDMTSISAPISRVLKCCRVVMAVRIGVEAIYGLSFI